MVSNLLRNIPSVSEILEQAQIKSLVDKVSHSVVAARVRSALDELRTELQTAATEKRFPSTAELAEKIAQWILQEDVPVLRPVINATGVLLHTGLGRAPLPEAALQAMSIVGADYASLEFDLESGNRSQRVNAVESLLVERLGCEAATVVNNNAGATMLALAAVAGGREVIVSRGQLVEIGGSFRLPDVMQAAGARLREVGTTNKTRTSDYQTAIGPETGALMRVHTSNYRVIGFTQTPSIEELIRLGREHDLPVIDDVGSGALVDFTQFGLAPEPMPAKSLAAGADLVLFSGDKLLGGPQCGIIAGRKGIVSRIAAHPMMRALRVDKLTLAALAATLRLYRDPKLALREIPLLQLLSTSLDNLQNRAERLAPQLAALEGIASATAIEDKTFLGGGSLPGEELSTWCLALEPAGRSVDQLAAALRTGTPSVVGRVQQQRLLLDLRSVFARQDQSLVAAVTAAVKGRTTPNPSS